MKSTERVLEQHPRLALGCVALVALAARLIAWSSFSASIYGSSLMPDEQIYDVYARAIQRGDSPPAIVGFTAHVPAYVFSLAYSVFGADPNSVRLLNVLLGAATCMCLYLAGATLENRTTGLITALLGALYGPFILASVTAHKTALELFLIGLTMALGVSATARPQALTVGLFAAALGLSVHVRGNALVFVVVAPAAFWWAWRRRDPFTPLLPMALAYGIGLAVVLVPLSSGGLFGATEHGFNLYLGNDLDNPTPYYRPARFASSQPTLQGGGFVLKASLEEGRTLSTAEARAYYGSKLRAAWAAHPREALGKAWTKLAASVNVYEHAHNHNLAFVSRFVRPLGWPWIGFGLLFPIAALGVLDGLRSRQRQWLVMMAIGYWLTLVVFFTDIRLRAPLALLLMPLGAVGLQTAVRRRGRALVTGTFVGACGLALTHLPVPGAGDLTTACNLHALMLFDAGNYAAAEEYYRASADLEGLDSESALLGLAAIAVKRDDLALARELLLKISDDHYKAAEKHAQLGGVLVRQHDFDQAAAAFERALEIDPSLLTTYPILEALYRKLGQSHRESDIRRRHQYATSFF